MRICLLRLAALARVLAWGGSPRVAPRRRSLSLAGSRESNQREEPHSTSDFALVANRGPLFLEPGTEQKLHTQALVVSAEPALRGPGALCPSCPKNPHRAPGPREPGSTSDSERYPVEVDGLLDSWTSRHPPSVLGGIGCFRGPSSLVTFFWASRRK